MSADYWEHYIEEYNDAGSNVIAGVSNDGTQALVYGVTESEYDGIWVGSSEDLPLVLDIYENTEN